METWLCAALRGRMPLGTERDLSTVNQGDTADLYAYVFDQDSNPIPAVDITSVSFVIQDPDGVKTTIAGAIEADGAGFVRYDTTSQVLGEYVAMAQFVLVSGEKRSTRLDFTIVDPFATVVPTRNQVIAAHVWDLLEDCFDSEEGGPWLRDMTLSFFDKGKVEQFIPYALLEVNNTPPATHLLVDDFVHVTLGPDGVTPVSADPVESIPVIAFGVLIQVIRHLMRSYVEQPAPMGSEVAYEDRRDYLQRWQMILQDLDAEWQRMLALWKRQFYHFGKSALSIHSKAGRLYGQTGTSWRLRNAGRGWY
jgi:hypothetical protein